MQQNPTVFAITLATTELVATEHFYDAVFGLKPIHQDDVSRVFRFGNTLINVLLTTDAEQLFAPAEVAGGTGHASMLTVQVESVDAEAARLDSLGVLLNTQPTDQAWGIRTITFADPAGQLWEFSNPL